MKIKVVNVILCFLLLFLYGCANIPTESALSEWVGKYHFSEFREPNIGRIYVLDIKEEQGQYFADISIDGYQTLIRVKAKVIGDISHIDLTFDEYMPDHMLYQFDEGTILCSLYSENGHICTVWGTLQPILQNISNDGKVVAFEKTEL